MTWGYWKKKWKCSNAQLTKQSCIKTKSKVTSLVSFGCTIIRQWKKVFSCLIIVQSDETKVAGKRVQYCNFAFSLYKVCWKKKKIFLICVLCENQTVFSPSPRNFSFWKRLIKNVKYNSFFLIKIKWTKFDTGSNHLLLIKLFLCI